MISRLEVGIRRQRSGQSPSARDTTPASVCSAAAAAEDHDMKTIRKIATTALILLAGLGLGRTSAQGVNSRSIEQYTCKDVMREHGDNRDVTIAFLHGFLLGKSGGKTFDLDILHKQTSDFIERCLDNPAERAVDAMSTVKG
jgi:HdeA/HdeB family